MPAGFSRLQLAAALLEYDNDPEIPQAPKRFAHESAIFAHFRRYLPSNTPRQTDYLSVALGDNVSSKAFRTVADYRQSRGSAYSLKSLRNPFKSDNIEEEDEDEEDLEVDFSSWGLDAFIPKDKDKVSRNRPRRKSTDLFSIRSHQPLTYSAKGTDPRRSLVASRSMSVGNLDELVKGKQIPPTFSGKRRRSVGTFMRPSETECFRPSRKASSFTPLYKQDLESLNHIPFPVCSKSIQQGDTDFSYPSQNRARYSSSDSVNISELPSREVQQAATRLRVSSNVTLNAENLAEENPFALDPPTHTSRFDPKANIYGRTMSDASLGTRPVFEEGTASPLPLLDRDHRYSTTLDLLRPKVLVMPSPLQPVSGPILPSADTARDGFELSTDGPPLPPGARSARRTSVITSSLDPPALASNSFTPNPLTSLSLSQVTFRNPLRAGLEENDGNLPRATEDGQKMLLGYEEREEFQKPATSDEYEVSKGARPPGKLFGKSLIDDLEERKAKMRNKQRVFTGDERPSMMAREALQRSSTLIDPATLRLRPDNQFVGSHILENFQDILKQRPLPTDPLLDFHGDGTAIRTRSQITASRSVFGVDTLWEKEMVKLREIEAQERAEENIRKAEESNVTKKKKKKKYKQNDLARRTAELTTVESGLELLVANTSCKPTVSKGPPVLPNIQRAHQRVPPQVSDNDTESDISTVQGPSTNKSSRQLDPDWHAMSSDEDRPHKTTGVGLRNPGGRRPSPRNHNDSDDDVPLSVAIQRIDKDILPAPSGGVDSDEDRPLSMLIPKQSGHLAEINFDNLAVSQEDEEDNQPLGIRASRVIMGTELIEDRDRDVDDDDDDCPLAYHPEQQRRQTQYQMLAQQQQFMIQAQMQNSVYLPPMMPAPFFAPSMMPMMMQAPQTGPSSPPVRDETKFGQVDRWRRNVAIEGDA